MEEIRAGMRLDGVLPGRQAEVAAFRLIPGGHAYLTLRREDGSTDDRIITAAEAMDYRLSPESGRSYGADGALFRLALEAARIKGAPLHYPYSAVDASALEPLPHQIGAVYGDMLARRPLSFLLADDPGAGKTIMSGLYIRELMLREALVRCLVVVPGSLAEQWQGEMW